MKSGMTRGWWRFLTLCRGSQSNAQLDSLLDLLLTHEEKQSIATRVLLSQALLKGKQTQREISEDLGISIAKITRGSNALKAASEPLKQYLQRGKK